MCYYVRVTSLNPIEISPSFRAAALYPHYFRSAPKPRRRVRRQRSGPIKRRTLFSKEIANAIYDIILTEGLKDSRAARLVGISPSTISRWKRKIPHFAEFLATARADFELAEIKAIVDATPRNARAEVARAKWLLQKSNPQKWGRPCRKPVM